MKESFGVDLPMTWSEVEDAQLRDWLRTTPAQRLAWLEEMLEFARMAGELQNSESREE